MEQKLTEEQKKDVESRINQFRDAYIDLVKKLDVDFLSYPQFTQTSSGAFVTIVSTTLVDKKYLPVPSPMGKIIKDA